MSSIKIPENNLTEYIDFEETFGKLTFLEQIADAEAREEDGSRGGATAVRFEVLSETQGVEFRVKIDLTDNPMIDLSQFSMDDEIELVEPQVFERNINNERQPNMIVTIEALDVKKKTGKAAQPASQPQTDKNKK
ncbi:DUF961 family protein [Enterococcus sp. BWM-S5]|uniref:DUF961 family protein n=1 Tax=Enterococcus larvae TaxID=2794352 RepID=A0ABS4CKW1_9ENTE|nr:DUF961 family protein [Enterococcus larvae]MBP1047119.1 DUF961 family protein [Enterococcus larvae]